MLRVGITGGIGSGKSMVAELFSVFGIPIYNADTAAKRIMATDPLVKKALVETFGANTYLGDELNRKYLADKVFADPAALEKLNAIVHPATIQDAEDWMQSQKAPYALKEAALIFESGATENLDFVIGVYAPEALRVHRVMKRDQVTRNQVLQRMTRQIPESLKMRLCDAVIVNNDRDMLIPQALHLHEQLLELSGVQKLETA